MTDRKKTSIKLDVELWKNYKIHCIKKNESLTDNLEKIIKLELGIGLIG